MAVYRLGDMVRMRREALGMTQEELVRVLGGGEICSTQTLRRIENGGVGRAKIGVFRKLMVQMGSLPERMYASLKVTECRALALKSRIRAYIWQRQYGEAERALLELEPMLTQGYPRNGQYLKWQKAMLAYCRGQTEAREHLEALWEAMWHTVPKLGEAGMAEWPFNANEFDILSDIANAYHAVGEREKELALLLALKKNVERGYMDKAYYVAWHARALAGLSQLMCMSDRHEESMAYCRTGMEECRRWRILGNVSGFLYDAAWNREGMIRKGAFPKGESMEQRDSRAKKERAFCSKQLVQAYYLSIAQGCAHEAERIKRLYEKYYGEAIKLL